MARRRERVKHLCAPRSLNNTLVETLIQFYDQHKPQISKFKSLVSQVSSTLIPKCLILATHVLGGVTKSTYDVSPYTYFVTHTYRYHPLHMVEENLPVQLIYSLTHSAW